MTIITAEEVLQVWIDKMEEIKPPGEQKEQPQQQMQPLLQKHQSYKVNWRKVEINHVNPKFTGKDADGMMEKSRLESTINLNNSNGKEPMEEEFTLTKRKMSSDVKFYQGVAIPKQASLPLPPAVTTRCEISAIQETALKVNEMMGEMIWTTKSKFVAPPGENLEFFTEIIDLTWKGPFTVDTRLSGIIVVAVYENDRFVQSKIGNIVEIFKYAKKKDKVGKFDSIKVDENRKFVSVETKGYMQFNFNVKKNCEAKAVKKAASLHEDSHGESD